MRKFYLLLLPLILAIALMACDAVSDNTDKNGTESSKAENVSQSGNENDKNESNVELPADAIEREFSDVALTFVGEDSLLNAGYKAKSKTVSVTVKGAKNIIDQMTSSDILAEADVTDVIETGNVELFVTYTVPDGVVITASESFVEVSITTKNPTITPPVNGDAYMSNGIIVSGNRGMEAFGGSTASGAKTAEKFNEFKAAVGSGVNVYALPCPTASAFYAPEKYSSSINAHINFFNGIRDNLVDVKFVDTLSALSEHTDEYIYYRTDFHWTGLAGYYAAEELALVAGTPFDKLSTANYTENCTESCFKGALVRYASVLGNDPDDVYWYVPTRQYTVTYYSSSGLTNPKTGMSLFSSANGYTKFMHGDAYTAHIQSNVGNGRKLLIFKNSYGNALAPYVLSSYDEVYIADIRKFQENAKEFIEEYGITDVCFAMSSHALAGDTRNYITKLLNY